MNLPHGPAAFSFEARAEPTFNDYSFMWMETDTGDPTTSFPTTPCAEEFVWNSVPVSLMAQAASLSQASAPMIMPVNSTFSSTDRWALRYPWATQLGDSPKPTTPTPTQTQTQKDRQRMQLSEPGEIKCWAHGCDGRRFSSWGNYRRHLREKNRCAKTFVCETCGRLFTRSTARNLHQARCKDLLSSFNANIPEEMRRRFECSPLPSPDMVASHCDIMLPDVLNWPSLGVHPDYAQSQTFMRR